MESEYTIPDGIRYAWNPSVHRDFIYALNKLYPNLKGKLQPTQRTVDACLFLGLGLLSTDYGLELTYTMVGDCTIELSIRYTLVKSSTPFIQKKSPVIPAEIEHSHRYPLDKAIMGAMRILSSSILVDLIYSEKLPQNKKS